MQLSGIRNFRDLGGARVADGRRVRTGLLFRSEAILDPDETDAEALRILGVRLVCDLRGEKEREDAPNRWWKEQGVPLLAMDFLAGIRPEDIWQAVRKNRDAAGAASAMKAVYRGLPEAAGDHLKVIFTRILRGDVPLLIHCTAGKDRTGFLSALILEALGVDRFDVVADYLASAGQATRVVVDQTRHMITKSVGSVGEEVVSTFMGVNKDYISESFSEIEKHYGSSTNYILAKTGYDSLQLHRFRDYMLR